MIQPATFDFLQQLSKHNNKEWFDKNRKKYEAAKKDHEQFVNELLQLISEKEPGFEGQKAKDCTFRIFRDVRFSKNKDPYKNNFGAVFAKGGKKTTGAGYYVHLEPGKSFIGGGIWMPDGETMKKIRQEIDYNFNAFQKIVDEKNFKKTFGEVKGERLKKAPQGYAEENPAIDFLKLKSFTVGASVGDKEVLDKNFNSKMLKIMAIMKPFIDFLNRAVE